MKKNKKNCERWYFCGDLAVVLDKELSMQAKYIFMILCTFITLKKRACWPSNNRVADAANVSPSFVSRAYEELEARGVIARSERFEKCKGGNRQTSSYTQIIGCNAECYKEVKNEEIPPLVADDNPPLSHMTNKEYHMNNIKDSFTREAELPTCVELPKTSESNKPVTPKTESESKPESDSKHDSTPKPESELHTVSPKQSESKPPIKAKDSFLPEDAPDIMRPTARYMLDRTGRTGFTGEEISALQELSKNHYPARVQKEIDIACERFRRRGKSLETLTFNYIAGALKYQKSRKRSAAPKRKRNPMSLTQAQIDAAQAEELTEEEALRELERLEGMLRQEELQRQEKLRRGCVYSWQP